MEFPEKSGNSIFRGRIGSQVHTFPWCRTSSSFRECYRFGIVTFMETGFRPSRSAREGLIGGQSVGRSWAARGPSGRNSSFHECYNFEYGTLMETAPLPRPTRQANPISMNVTDSGLGTRGVPRTSRGGWRATLPRVRSEGTPPVSAKPRPSPRSHSCQQHPPTPPSPRARTARLPSPLPRPPRWTHPRRRLPGLPGLPSGRNGSTQWRGFKRPSTRDACTGRKSVLQNAEAFSH